VGFRTREVMTGWHEFTDGAGPAGRHPFAFRATWGPDSLRAWLDPRSPAFLWQELEGEVLAGGLCAWTPCQGTLHLRYFPERRIRYDFDFEVGNTTYRYVGQKTNLRWWNLAVTHTTCYGVVTERGTDRLVSTGTTTFHLRDLPRLLMVRAA
jgi:hypothetical protein